jgi:hypothetical protein
MKAWTWKKDKTVSPLIANTVTPLGNADSSTPQGQVLPYQPSMAEEVASAMTTKAGMQGIDNAVKGLSNPSAKTIAPLLGKGAQTDAGSQAAMLAEQSAGFGSTGTDAIAQATGASTSVLGPLAAAAGGIAEGNYGKAAGSAAGATLGASLGPLGSYIGSRIGGYLGSGLGFEQGTTNVSESSDPKQVDQAKQSLHTDKATYDHYLKKSTQAGLPKKILTTIGKA